MTTPGLEPHVQSSHGAVDQFSQNSMALIHKGLNDTLAQLTKASETQTATLASLKKTSSFVLTEEADKDEWNMSNTQLNVSPMLNNMLPYQVDGHIDDSFLLGYEYTACKRDVQGPVDAFQKLGLVIHPVKSVFYSYTRNRISWIFIEHYSYDN